ncbi:hypothetical protein CABS01_15035 [Colletotrichum abscissum]|uniref:uncharacterized protein n=1 Tax=Colletotrichum abscissum TaxID=1671311 RepID=UPI0027D763CA|nr:uncharacterized protein CABS01_15035 [Colletotrichum abscissum]KAK1477338.1 hypothetical protein CABS01_15035 [Colletotrichum abscissum]
MNQVSTKLQTSPCSPQRKGRKTGLRLPWTTVQEYSVVSVSLRELKCRRLRQDRELRC